MKTLIALLLAVTLTWDANPETDLAGYRIYRDGELIATVPKTQTRYTDAVDGNLYFIRAFNLSGLESGNSNLVVNGLVTIY